MNLLNGVFSKGSAFSKVNPESTPNSLERHGRSMEHSTNLNSNSSNPSIEDRRKIVYSSEKYSSSSERDLSMNSDKGRSLERPCFPIGSPLKSSSYSFIKPKAMNPNQNSNFNFLSKWKLNGINSFGMNPSLYWMKLQMMMKQSSNIGNFTNIAAFKPSLSHKSSFSSSDNDIEERKCEVKMIGRLTESERRKKVDRYLQKKRRKSKAVRYEWRK